MTPIYGDSAHPIIYIILKVEHRKSLLLIRSFCRSYLAYVDGCLVIQIYLWMAQMVAKIDEILFTFSVEPRFW